MYERLQVEEESLQNYNKAVREYTYRKLGYTGHTLAAFTGVLLRLHLYYGLIDSHLLEKHNGERLD